MTESDKDAMITELVVAIDKTLSGMGANGRMPSPRLQHAMNKARRAVPSIPPQTCPVDEDADEIMAEG
jgi:hypothetical protein